MVGEAGKIRIAVLHFAHETVTFLKNDTTLSDFIYPGSPASGEALLKAYPKSYMGGFVKMAREFAGVELVGIESPLWPKTYMGSGWVTSEAFETLVGRMIEGLKAQGPFDGVYLSLHGAMAVRGVSRPEAELARRVREVVGVNARIVATFDLHGNEDDEFLKHADVGFAVKYFPHYDEYLQGERAARMLVRMIRGDYALAHVTRKVPILTATVRMWTGASPWMDLIQRALVWEAREVDVYVNVFFGFPFADVPDVGITVQVMTNGNDKLAASIATDIADFAWRKREAMFGATKIHSMAEGVRLTKAAVAKGESPVVLADHSDRSGSATFLLKEIIAQDLSDAIIATIADADATAKVKASGARGGDPFDMEIGGRVDESAGEPVRIKGAIIYAAEAYGQFWVAVKFGRGNLLILSTYLVQMMEPFSLGTGGIDIHAFKVFAIKSRVHFRRGFDDNGFAKTILLVEPDKPFLGTVHLDALPYENVDLKKYYPYGEPDFSA
jgi:microcystin degradation protein MlrC